MSTAGTLVGTTGQKAEHHVVRARYDFSTHGGAIGDAQGLGVIIPKGAVVTRVIGNVVTTLASDGAATIAINLGSTEVNAATAYNHADYVGSDIHYDSAAVMAADSVVNLDIAGAALTAGVYDIFVEYFL
jgi:hypothetical protein